MVAERAMSGGDPPRSAKDELRLIVGLAEYDPAVWEVFFGDNYQRVFRYAYARLGSVTDAEDASAATFLAAVKSIGRFKPRGVPITGWLLRIAHHETVNVQRRNRRHHAAVALDPEVMGRDGSALPDIRIDLRDALATLRPEERAIVVLRLVEGNSIAEVASILGKTEGAVKMMQGRALRKLRDKLGRGWRHADDGQ